MTAPKQKNEEREIRGTLPREKTSPMDEQKEKVLRPKENGQKKVGRANHQKGSDAKAGWPKEGEGGQSKRGSWGRFKRTRRQPFPNELCDDARGGRGGEKKSRRKGKGAPKFSSKSNRLCSQSRGKISEKKKKSQA